MFRRLQTIGPELRTKWRQRGRTPVHFLHIGKNAGTQIERRMEALNTAQTRYALVKHPHSVTLSGIPNGEAYFFSIRRPENRFVSGFYSRKRKGQPRIYKEWSAHEARAFAAFEHANDLAEALNGEGARAKEAFSSMKAISHVSMNQVDWFSRQGFLFDERPPVHVIRQEAFEEDFAMFLEKLGLEAKDAAPATDAVSAHRGDYENAPPLSERARANLARWYAQDVAFYDVCERWINTSPNGDV